MAGLPSIVPPGQTGTPRRVNLEISRLQGAASSSPLGLPVGCALGQNPRQAIPIIPPSLHYSTTRRLSSRSHRSLSRPLAYSLPRAIL
jgi:hypothetical protein